MTDDDQDELPSDDLIRETVWYGYVVAMLENGYPHKDKDAFLAEFDRWLNTKLFETPEAEFVRKYGDEWDAIDSTDEYADFADSVGYALDRIRGKK